MRIIERELFYGLLCPHMHAEAAELEAPAAAAAAARCAGRKRRNLFNMALLAL
jgi:hypothetical protein